MFGGYIDGDGKSYSTINKGWWWCWKAVEGWRRWGAMTINDHGGRDMLSLSNVVRIQGQGDQAQQSLEASHTLVS